MQNERKKDHTFPPKPGNNGRAAVFVCPVCGNKFVKTMDGQSKCLECMDKETASDDTEKILAEGETKI